MRGREAIFGAINLWCSLNRITVKINRLGARRHVACCWFCQLGTVMRILQAPLLLLYTGGNPLSMCTAGSPACRLQAHTGEYCALEGFAKRLLVTASCCAAAAVPCGKLVAIDASQEFTPHWWPASLPGFVQWNHILLTLADGPYGCAHVPAPPPAPLQASGLAAMHAVAPPCMRCMPVAWLDPCVHAGHGKHWCRMLLRPVAGCVRGCDCVH